MANNKIVFKVLGENVKALRQSPLTPDGMRSINKFAKWAHVANGTLDRIERGVTDPQLSHIVAIASKYETYGIQPWHLLVTDFDPMHPPRSLSRSEREVFEAVSRAYSKLPHEEAPYVPTLHEPGMPPKSRGAVHSLRRRKPRRLTP